MSMYKEIFESSSDFGPETDLEQGLATLRALGAMYEPMPDGEAYKVHHPDTGETLEVTEGEVEGLGNVVRNFDDPEARQNFDEWWEECSGWDEP